MATYYENVTALAPKVWFKFNETTGSPVNSGSASCNLQLVGFGSSLLIDQPGVIDRSVKMVGEKYYTFSQLSNVMQDKSFTIEFWHKAPVGTQSNQGLFTNVTGVSTNAIGIEWNGSSGNANPGKYVFTFRGGSSSGGGTYYTLIPSVTFTENEWHHIVATFSTTAAILYVDGTNVAQQLNPVYGSDTSFESAQTRYIGGPATGWYDELAIYSETLTSQQVYDNYNSAFNSLNLADVSTASALAVDPAISAEAIILETPATATADIGDIQVSNFNLPTMLDGYLAGRSFEQWYKFDEIGKIKNYGSGGNAETAWAFNGSSINVPEGGIQGSGALKIKAEVGNSVRLAFGVNQPYSTEITDNEFSIGVWFKGESGFGAKNTNLAIFTNPFSTDYYQVLIDTSGYPVFAANGTQLRTVTVTTNVLDGNWHLIQARASDTDNQIAISLDNGTEATTAANGAHWPSGIASMELGKTPDTGTNNKYGYISNMWITGYSSIGSTERAAMITAAAVPIQASAGMVQPIARFENAFNDKTHSYTPTHEFRLDDTTGTPINFGSLTTFSAGINGSDVTYGNASLNAKSYRFTNALTFLQGDWTAPTGTFTTNAAQTVSVVFKANGYTSFQQILASTGQKGFLGTGITIQMAASTGHLSAKLNRGFGGTDTETVSSSTNVGDNQWHHAVAVKEGSNFTLYLDGKQLAQITNSAITPSDSGTWGVSCEGKYNTGQASASKDTYIDEFAVIADGLSAQEVFELYQSIQNQTEWTASSLAVDPAITAGFGPIIAQPAMTASAEFSNVFPFIPPMLVDAMFQNPNYAATQNTDNLAEPMTADAQGENPGFDIGENQSVLHMDATASFPDARALIPGFWNASPAIAIPAEMVDPVISSTLGALIKADALPANAFFQLPPAYYLITDDLWYQRLLEIDYQSETANGLITFFNTSSDIYLAGGYDGWNAFNNRNPFNDNYGYNLYDSPLPVAGAGYFDTVNRKALNLRNIALEKGDRETPVATWTMELMIQTTKKNQFITSAFYGGDPSSSVSRKKRTGIRLKDGKIAFTGLIDSTLGMLNSNSEIQFTGFKDIADGEWHHVIIQRRGDGVDEFTPRMQVWIDGKLDIQRFGAFAYAPGQIGYNSNDPDAYSDFNISAISINRGSFVLEREIILNYLASFNIIPVKAPAATATAEIGQGSQAAGNRPRALMLYFWPTETAQGSQRFPGFTSNESADVLTTLDYFTKPPQEYEGWDVFPVDITGRWVSDLVKPEAYGIGNIASTNFIKDVTPYGRPEQADIALFNTAGTFKDPVTDAARYIDLINDVDLSKFDMIMFKNYPNESNEKDAFTGEEVVDAYFNLRESSLFADFLKTLRAAVDTGLSLMVSSAQLALDLKIVDRVELVPDMDDNLGTDPYAPTQVIGTGAENLPTPPEYKPPLGWFDTWKNNRTRIVNTHPDITDYPGLIKTQQAFWYNTDEFRWGGPDRIFAKYEHRDALAVGDEFVISTTGQRANQNQNGYLASPFENVKAGKIITAFANTVRRGVDLIENPYRNYAQSIILEPGDILDGTQVGGKIFVNFTEEINKAQESGSVELISDYWVNYAYDNGAIDLETRDFLLLQDFVTTETPYWSVNGMHLLQQRSGEFELDTDFKRAGVQKDTVKVRKVNKNGGISFRSVPQGSVFFSSEYSWQYPMAGFEVPSMPTRGFRWLSNREVLEGTVLRPQAFIAQAEMPNAAGVPDRESNFNAQSMVASAQIEETQFSSGERQVIALPMTATADIVKPGSTIGAPPMLANAKMFDNSRSNVASEDQVVLYLMHVDPILYIREDVIK